MATLADELQNDFADSGSENEEEAPQENEERSSLSPDPNGHRVGSKVNGAHTGMDVDGGEEDEEEDVDMGAHPDALPGEAEEETEARLEEEKKRARIEKRDREGPSDMRKVNTFMKSMEPVLEKIAYYQSLPPDQRANPANISGSIEDHPEYQLLTKSNNFSTSIDDHATEVHKYIRDHYSVRFPELETLLSDPLEYTKAVAVIGNGPMDKLRDITSTPHEALNNQSLTAILSRPKLMTVTVEATTTKGTPLPPQELTAIKAACTTMLRLESAKKTLTDYVQSRMNLFAPNLTRLVGSLVAAQLLNARGGLTALSETAASNIPAIGSRRAAAQAAAGLATNVGGPRSQGHLFESDLIRRQRPELRTQAMRIVSAKIVLAARVDRVHASPDGSTGDDLREQCEKRLDDLMKPPPNKGQRALPAPDDKPARKRGGRRARKAKEATAMTEMRMAQNRVAFGKEEREVDSGSGVSVGLGMIGQRDDGRVRAMQVDQRTRAKLSKKNQGWGTGTSTSSNSGGATSVLKGPGAGSHGLRTSGVATSLGSATAGTASSLAFTPKQGLELVDPKARAEMERRGKAEEDRWFKGGTFTQVGGGTSTSAAGTMKDGFKVPSLPVKRKAADD